MTLIASLIILKEENTLEAESLSDSMNFSIGFDPQC